MEMSIHISKNIKKVVRSAILVRRTLKMVNLKTLESSSLY